MRPKQWVKNSFVLAPLVFAGVFLDPNALRHALLAAALFCLASSATYVINDMHDIGHDRLHPTKSKTRPLAAGLVRIRTAVLLLLGLLGLLLWGCVAAPRVGLVIGAYLLLNLAYTSRAQSPSATLSLENLLHAQTLQAPELGRTRLDASLA